MRRSQILKEAFLYQWFNILLGHFFADRHSPLPIKYTKREVAQKITFSWGYMAFVCIGVLVFLFFIFRYVNTIIPVLISLAVILVLSLVFSSAVSCLYLFIAGYLELKESGKLGK